MEILSSSLNNNELKKVKSLTVTMLVLKFILIFSYILFLILVFPSIAALSKLAADRPDISAFSSLMLIFVLGFFLFVLGIAAFIIHILVCIKASKIDNTSFILLLIGFFIGIVDLVGGFILLSKINRQIEENTLKMEFGVNQETTN
ncbi:hypothetical protein DP067_03685 [Mycoplasmopsis anatis]|uniref:DUF4064 domain-containing protein n=1 Tax=Mycoplasmopsis anatis 1340 TaxID=1034808 RepID=F9QE94_9BACT|nr:hypothetical protein [Mycoplasmopsis anatis]AWX70428.1 hypothetical protein DP067_03685 [Mycoplasmopsis anatis]EGS28905.1 hypothetical protein GIG_03517 [Mycoplasmopsis anatis 1340]VEU73916.1 Uncharacterised protein [Mycoplasmopsis anatis]